MLTLSAGFKNTDRHFREGLCKTSIDFNKQLQVLKLCSELYYTLMFQQDF